MTHQTANFSQDLAVRHAPVSSGVIGLPQKAVYISSTLLHMPALDDKAPSQAAACAPKPGEDQRTVSSMTCL